MIPIKYFENDIYSIIPTINNKNSITYMDFNYNYVNNSNTNYCNTSIYQKSIQLDYFEIEYNLYLNNNLLYKDIFYFIKNKIDKDIFTLIKNLGEKNRLNAPSNITNFNIEQIKKETNVTKNITQKIAGINNYIYTQGHALFANPRSDYIISNNKTYKYIFDNLDINEIIFDNKSNYLTISNIPYLVNDNIDDDIILIGRKASKNDPGVYCAILTDEDGNIIINEMSNISYNKKKIIQYRVFDIGNNPEYQFMKLDIRSLSYYRGKKLKRIKEIYGT